MGSGETTPRPGTAPSHYSTTTPGEGKQGERHRPSSCPARKEPPGHWVLMANPYPARLRSDRFRPPGRWPSSRPRSRRSLVLCTPMWRTFWRGTGSWETWRRELALQDGCAQFEKQAAAMKNKFWMENLKAIIAGSVVGLIVLGLIYWKFFMDDNSHYGAPPQGYYPPPQAGPEPAGDGAAGDAGEAPAEEAPAVNDGE